MSAPVVCILQELQQVLMLMLGPLAGLIEVPSEVRRLWQCQKCKSYDEFVDINEIEATGLLLIIYN